MHLLDLTLPRAEENLALDEALLLEAEAGRGGEMLRFWEWPEPAVVLGAGGRLREDVNEAACEADRVPILRRASGGGSVLLGKGCLLFSLVLSYDRSPPLREIPSSYCYILGVLREALSDIQPGAACAGTSDLAVDGKKFSGNSQQRKRRYLLHHGTLLYDFSVKQIGRYLHPPVRQPEYRSNRSHDEFVINLGTSAAMLKERLRTAWRAEDSTTMSPMEAVRRLVTEKYGTVEWVRRR